jgi:hypothetical protein
MATCPRTGGVVIVTSSDWRGIAEMVEMAETRAMRAVKPCMVNLERVASGKVVVKAKGEGNKE